MLSHNIAYLNVWHKDIVHQCLWLIHHLQMAEPCGHYSACSKSEILTAWLGDLLETKGQYVLSEKKICCVHTNKLNMPRNALALHLSCTEHLASVLLKFLGFQSKMATFRYFTHKKWENLAEGMHHYHHFTVDRGTERLEMYFKVIKDDFVVKEL